MEQTPKAKAACTTTTKSNANTEMQTIITSLKYIILISIKSFFNSKIVLIAAFQNCCENVEHNLPFFCTRNGAASVIKILKI